MEEQKRPFVTFPCPGRRIIKTLISVLLVALVYDYLLGGRNPCFAAIGAVYGMGGYFREGARNGGNRFVGTLLGGLVVIPFYWLYYNAPFGIPNYVYLLAGLFLTIYINLMFGAGGAVQPGTVIYFVVMCTQPAGSYVAYTVARIIDTGVGVLFSLAINAIFPAPKDKEQKAALQEATQTDTKPEEKQVPRLQ